jgi:hypothetical protein
VVTGRPDTAAATDNPYFPTLFNIDPMLDAPPSPQHPQDWHTCGFGAFVAIDKQHGEQALLIENYPFLNANTKRKTAITARTMRYPAFVIDGAAFVFCTDGETVVFDPPLNKEASVAPSELIGFPAPVFAPVMRGSVIPPADCFAVPAPEVLFDCPELAGTLPEVAPGCNV